MRYLLWSGGFDSTYILCKWAMESDESIQPVYEVFPSEEKANIDCELEAIPNLLNLIRSKEIKAEIKDPLYIHKEDLPESEEYDQAYERKKSEIPHTMWDSIGKMGLLYPQIAIGIEAPAPSYRKIGRLKELLLNGGLEIIGGVITLNKGDTDLLTLFGNLTYPVIDTMATEELEAYKAWGFEDIMKSTWTCGSSLKRQCGVCGNCEVKWRYGDTFKWMFDEEAQKFHKVKEFLADKGDDWVLWLQKYAVFNEVTIRDEEGNTQARKSLQVMAYFDDLLANIDNMESVEMPKF